MKKFNLYRLYAIVTVFCLSNCLCIWANDVNLLPMPQSYKQLNRNFTAKQLSIVVPDGVRTDVTDFCNSVQIEVAENCKHVLKVVLVDSLGGIPINEREAYKLKVTSRLIEIQAVSADGVYWALQTLRQLAVQNGKMSALAVAR